jgi:hypothetical protein
MANHARAVTKKKLDPTEVQCNLIKILKEKLHDLFQFEYNPEEKLWYVFYKKDNQIGFQFWISDEIDYEEEDGKLVSKDSVLEFRHGHGWQFMWWVEGVVRENLGKIYNAQMFDEGCEIEPKPVPEHYETFEIFCSTKPDCTPKEKKYVKQSKRMWLPDYQLEELPKELIEGLNLDFKV